MPLGKLMPGACIGYARRWPALMAGFAEQDLILAQHSAAGHVFAPTLVYHSVGRPIAAFLLAMTAFAFRPWSFALLSLCLPALAQAQSAAPAPATDQSAAQWYLKDPELDKVPGIGATRAYAELLKNRPATPVVVAVIDSGIDTAHADLKPVLWRNPREIAGNGIDDDKNGYVDDIHGWNFLGGADGRNIDVETLEMTRLVARYRPLFKGKSREKVPAAQRAEFDLYKQAEKAYQARTKEASADGSQLQELAPQLELMVQLLKRELHAEKLDTTILRSAHFSDSNLQHLTEGMLDMMRSVGAADTDAALAIFNKELEQGQSLLGKSLSLTFNPRADIVKDDPENLKQRIYGNADLHGPDPLHGTHVSGIIAAVRDNNFGVQGVGGPLVRIMTVRAVPDGDERDKDVANAIRYAVDNGAQIINMSFGKDFSPQRAAIDEAFRYAAAKNVLLVHAAGNEDDDLAVTAHYPASTFTDGKPVPNLLTVGASGPRDDASLAADFSNYNNRLVDVFAPGVNIYNTLPGSTYGNESGTSMASPVVAGVAATLKSYFPRLSATDLKRIIQESAQIHHTKVHVPGVDKQADFSTLSATGGIVDLYEAVKLAQKTAAQ
jgi:subtilisin family serine protease